MGDTVDLQLTRAVNTSYGIGITNATPRVTGAVIPKMRVTNTYTTDVWVAGSVQTPLRLTQPIMTTSGDLMLSSASGSINMSGSSIINYAAPSQTLLDLYYQSPAPADPSASVLRVYVDGSGQLSWKSSTGVTATLNNSALTANRTFTLPNVTTTIVGTDAAQTLSNKTIDTAGPNTIRVGGVDITTLVGQDVRTSASPTFVGLGLTGQLTLNTATFHPIIINQSSSTTSNDILFQKTGSDIFAVGTNETTNETYTWGFTARDYKIGTNNTERLRILSTGIANDNSITSVLGLQGTTLVFKNNLADASTSQTFTNKTIDTAGPNTIRVGGVDITTLVGQDVRISASPTFQSISSTTGSSQFGGKIFTTRGTATTTDASTVTLNTIATSSNTVTFLYLVLNAYCTAGANAGLSCGQRMLVKVINVAGTLTISIISNLFSNSFATGYGANASGSTINVQSTGIASNTIRWTSNARVLIE